MKKIAPTSSKSTSTSKLKSISAIFIMALLFVSIITPVHAAYHAASAKSTRAERILAKMKLRQAAKLFKTKKTTLSPVAPAPMQTSTPTPVTAPTPMQTPTITPTPISATIAPPIQTQITPAPTIVTPISTPAVTPPPVLPPVPDLHVATQLHNGLYVWHATDLLNNPDAWIAKLQSINIGSDQKINEIYLTAYHGTYASLATQYQSAIIKLHAANYQVYMLAGNYDWALPATWNWINANYVPLAANFDGVMLDVEPWTTTDTTTKTWWASTQASSDFQTFLNNWKTAIGQNKKLTLSIANWHDVITPSQMNLLTNIYTSNADFVTIMDYSTSDYINRIAYETSLAKPTSIAFDIDKIVTPDPTIIFYTLGDLQKAVTTTLQTYPGIRGFGINDETLLTAN